MAEVVSIHIVRKRKGPAEPHEQVMIHGNFGIEGDYRSGKYISGQVTLIEHETMDMVSSKLGINVTPGASRRQIVVKGIMLNDLIGHKLLLGPTILLVEEKCKPCDNMEKSIGAGAKNAMDGNGGIRCHVAKGGTLRVGDKMTVEKTCCPYLTKLSMFPFKLIKYIKKRITM